MASEVKYRITAEDNTESGTNKAKGNLNSFESAIKKVGLAIAAVFAVNKIVDFFEDSAKAAMDAEASQARFQAALMATGHTHDISTAKINAYASALQKVTKFEDDTIVATLGQLQSLADLNEEGLMKVTPAMLDFGEAIGSVDTAANLIGKTLSGSMNALGRYGIQIDMTASKEDKLKQITEQLYAKYGGLAEVMGQTAVGRLTQLKNAWNDVQEEVGRFLLAGAKPLIEALTNISEGIKSFMQDSEKMKGFEDIIKNISAGLSGFIAGFELFFNMLAGMGGDTISSVTKSLSSFGNAGKELNSIFLGVAAIMEIVYLRMAVITAGIKVLAAIVGGTKALIDRMSGQEQKDTDAFRTATQAKETEYWNAFKSGEITQKQFDTLQSSLWNTFTAYADRYNTTVDNMNQTIVDSIGEVVGKTLTMGDNISQIYDKMTNDYTAAINKMNSAGRAFKPLTVGEVRSSEPIGGIGGGGGSAAPPGNQGDTAPTSVGGTDLWNVVFSFIKDLLGSALDELITELKDTLRPLIDMLLKIFDPVKDGVMAVVEALITVIRPILDIISPSLKGLGAVLKAISPAIKLFGAILTGVIGFVAGIINGIVDVINFLLGWAGVNLPHMDMSASSSTTSTTDNGTDTGSVAGGTAQYTAAPVINMTVNVYATAITAGDKIMTIEDLAKLLNEKLNAALELK